MKILKSLLYITIISSNVALASQEDQPRRGLGAAFLQKAQARQIEQKKIAEENQKHAPEVKQTMVVEPQKLAPIIKQAAKKEDKQVTVPTPTFNVPFSGAQDLLVDLLPSLTSLSIQPNTTNFQMSFTSSESHSKTKGGSKSSSSKVERNHKSIQEIDGKKALVTTTYLEENGKVIKDEKTITYL